MDPVIEELDDDVDAGDADVDEPADDVDEEKNFCYIEGSTADKAATDQVAELHENVWYRVRPPKPSTIHASTGPFVSARQIDLVRNMLLGRMALKSIKTECQREICEKPVPRRDVITPPCLKTRKSSVKFLNKTAYENIASEQ